MWIHEGWTTYLESLYVEYRWGKEDALKYTNGYKAKVKNEVPIISQRGVNATPPPDQYFKGTLFLNTLRSVINDDNKWFALIHDLFQKFKYQNIMTEDIVTFFNEHTGLSLTPIFNQYLRHKDIPTLELKFDEAQHSISYRWLADEPAFAMPVRIATDEPWQIIFPTTEWQKLPAKAHKDEMRVATDLYFINVVKK
jgi:aminopeptidase N